MPPNIVFFSKIKEKITEPGTENAEEKKCKDFEYYHGKSFSEFFRKGLLVSTVLFFSGPDDVKPAESPGMYSNSTGTMKKVSPLHF